jgi:hypothetical protein
VIAAFALTAIMMQAPARDARPASSVGTATIAGVVVSADSQPLPLRRARVTINGSTLVPGRTAITADDGSFAFTGLRAGRYVLTAAKDGYVAMSSTVMRPGPPAARVSVVDGETQKVSLGLPRGAVITGVILDVDGQPAAGMPVNALARRYVGTQGERRYFPAGTTVSFSDDRGMYRIYGLPAGEYLVAAQPRNLQVGLGPTEVRTMSRGIVSDKSMTLAQVFHPGATDPGRAPPVAIRAGEERSGIDVQLQYVPLATISGIATAGAGWSPARLTMVRVDEVPGFEPVRSARADADGRFTINGVPPGQYRLLAGTISASPVTSSGSPLMLPSDLLTAVVDISVNGEDVEGVNLSLQPALTVSGRLEFEGERAAPDVGQLRVPIPASLNMANLGQGLPPIQFESGGKFKVSGIVPGPYRLVGNIRTPIGAWWLKSLVIGGREALDSPLDLRQSVDDAVATLADRASELSGTVKDAQGNAVTDQFVVVFSTDRSTWFFNSRRVAGVRADAQGRYVIRNLPPGEYRLIAAVDLDPGEWFDPSVLERLLPAAGPLTVTGVETQTRDLVIRH